MSNIFSPFGFSPTDMSLYAGICSLSGVIGALSIASFLDRTTLYRKTHITIGFMALLSWVVLYMVYSNVEVESVGVNAFVFALVGVSNVSFFPVSLSYGAELTFPLQPALVNACVNFMGQVSALVIVGAIAHITHVDAAHDNIKSLEAVEECKENAFLAVRIFIVAARSP